MSRSLGDQFLERSRLFRQAAPLAEEDEAAASDARDFLSQELDEVSKELPPATEEVLKRVITR